MVKIIQPYFNFLRLFLSGFSTCTLKFLTSLSKASVPNEQLVSGYRIASSLPGGHTAQDIVYLSAAFPEQDTGAQPCAVPDITEHGHRFILGNIRHPILNMPHIYMLSTFYVAFVPFILPPVI
jgi:hypothetical protein